MNNPLLQLLVLAGIAIFLILRLADAPESPTVQR